MSSTTNARGRRPNTGAGTPPLWFGGVGLNSWQTTEAGLGVVTRTTEATVRYVAPPNEAKLPQWRVAGETAEGHPQFTLGPLPEATTAEQPVRSLHELGLALHRKRRKCKPGDELLVELDWMVRRLLEVTRVLHAARQTLGLIHPLNVFRVNVRKADGQTVPRLLLTDLGFVWSSGGATPDWLVKPAEMRTREGGPESAERAKELEFRAAWYPNPEAVHATFDKKRDVANLARLFDWVLSGKVRSVVPEAKADPTVGGFPVFAALGPAVGGQVESVGGLRKGLAIDPEDPDSPTRMGEPFLQEAGKAKRPRRPVGRWVGLTLLLGLLAAGGWGVWRLLPPSPPPVPGHKLCPECHTGDRLYPHLDRLDQLLVQLEAAEVATRGKPDHVANGVVNDAGTRDLPAVVAVVESMHRLVADAPAADPDVAKREAACLASVRERVQREMDRWLGYDNYTIRSPRFLRSEDLPWNDPEVVKQSLARVNTALATCDRLKVLSPQTEEKVWQPDWQSDLTRHRDRLVRRSAAP